MTQTTSGKAAPPGSSRDTVLTFNKDSDKLSVYKTVGAWPHPGSLKSGVPSRVVVIAGVETAPTMDVRIYDVKNALVVAEAQGVSASYPELVDLGAISNVSTGPTIWELQYRRASGSGNQTVAISSATLEY
jgi:hypothetical protein